MPCSVFGSSRFLTMADIQTKNSNFGLCASFLICIQINSISFITIWTRNASKSYLEGIASSEPRILYCFWDQLKAVSCAKFRNLRAQYKSSRIPIIFLRAKYEIKNTPFINVTYVSFCYTHLFWHGQDRSSPFHSTCGSRMNKFSRLQLKTTIGNWKCSIDTFKTISDLPQ